MRLTGFAAIEYAAQEGLTLSKSGYTPAEERHGLTIAEATAVAEQNPQAIWVDVPEGGAAGREKAGQARH